MEQGGRPGDGTFLPEERLRSLYEGQGVTAAILRSWPTAGSASAAPHTWFVLHELLGYPHVRNYDGSWTEWGSLVGVPVEKG